MKRRNLITNTVGAILGAASALVVGRYAGPSVPVSAATPEAPEAEVLSPKIFKPGDIAWYHTDGTAEGLLLVPVIVGNVGGPAIERCLIMTKYDLRFWTGHWSEVSVVAADIAWKRCKGLSVDPNLGHPATGSLVPGTVFAITKGDMVGRWGVVGEYPDPDSPLFSGFPRNERERQRRRDFIAAGNFEGMLATAESQILMVHRSDLD